MLRAAIFACLACGATSAAWAQSFDLHAQGRVALSYSNIDDGTAIGALDLTLSVPVSRSVPVTFELGTYLFALNGKRPHETYAAFALSDQLRVGVVRPAYDAVLTSSFETSAPYLAYDRAEYSRAYTTVEAMRRTAVPWGVSYQGKDGPLEYAVSVHDARKGVFRTATAAAKYSGTGFSLAAAIEGVWAREDGTYQGMNAKLGARGDINGADVGVTYLHADANERDDAVALDVAIPATGKLTLRAMGEFTKSGQDDAYGIGLDYQATDSGTVIFSATDSGADPAFHIGFEQKF